MKASFLLSHNCLVSILIKLICYFKIFSLSLKVFDVYINYVRKLIKKAISIFRLRSFILHNLVYCCTYFAKV